MKLANWKSSIKLVYLTFIGCGIFACNQKEKVGKPNVILIVADDLGYGDIAYGDATSRMYTPILDSLAQNGIKFTNAHASSAVCTPSRYSILTGRYPWRSKLKSGVLFGFDAPIIDTEISTIGGLFQNSGYTTACIGKWHLGIPWTYKTSSDYLKRTADSISFSLLARQDEIDSSNPIADKLWYKKVGFDSFFGISASLDIPPYGFIENGKFQSDLDSFLPGSEQSDDYHSDYWREGLSTAEFDPYQVLDSLIIKSKSFISNQEEPFFLYIPLTAPHTPWLPGQEFKGSSQAGKYGDFVAKVDASIQQIIEALSETDKLKNTILIFTSDNGAPKKGIEQYGGNGHRPNGKLRGQKGDLYEGGHRVPLIISNPNYLQSGIEVSDLVSLTDLYATCAEILSMDSVPATAIDSRSFYDLLLGKAHDARKQAVYHSQIGKFAIQNGKWKYIDILGSGGFTKPRLIEPSENIDGQLFNIYEDIFERTDLYTEYPEVVRRLKNEIDSLRDWN